MGHNLPMQTKPVSETRAFWLVATPMLILGIIMIVILIFAPN